MLLALASCGFSTPSFVQGKNCGAASPIPCTFAGNVTSGNQIKVGTIEFGVSAPTVTDSQGNTYTAAYTTGLGGAVVLLTATASSTGPLTVTLTRAGTFAVSIAEFSGSGATLDGTSLGSGHPFGNTLASLGALTTTASADLIVCVYRDDSGSAAYANGFWDGGAFEVMHAISGVGGGVGMGYSIPATTIPGYTGYYVISDGNSGTGGCAAFQTGSGPPPSSAITRRFIGMGR